MTVRALCGDSPDTLTTVARFLSLLELFREGAVGFDQVTPLGELTVRWTGDEQGDIEIQDEFDGTPPESGPVDSAPAAEMPGAETPGAEDVDEASAGTEIGRENVRNPATKEHLVYSII